MRTLSRKVGEVTVTVAIESVLRYPDGWHPGDPIISDEVQDVEDALRELDRICDVVDPR